MIRGSSVYAPADLFAIYRDALGEPITRASARDVVLGLAEKYENDGYSRPQIRLDDALVALGVLRIDVFEARINKVSINGDPGPHRGRLEQAGSQIEQGGLIRPPDLQAALQRIRTLPGLTVSATTAQDAAETNVYRLDLDAEFAPVAGALRLTNRGTDEIGPNFLLGQVVRNGVLGGRTNVGLLFGAATDYDEYHGLGLLANTAIDSTGGRAAVTLFQSRSDPREAGTDRDLGYVRDRLSLRVTKPLGESTARSFSVSAALELEDLAIDLSGLVLRDERLRMLELGGRWSWRSDSATQYASSVDLVKGLGGWGSGLYAPDLAEDLRREDFTLLRLSLTRLTRFAEHWSVRLDALAQQSGYVLPYSERFKIGGDRLGRGFEVAEIAGDRGAGAKVELRRQLRDAPAVLGRTSVYGFYDVGAAWKQDAAGRESAATAGLGFAMQGRKTSAHLEVAKPLTHPDVEGREDLTLFLELTMRL